MFIFWALGERRVSFLVMVKERGSKIFVDGGLTGQKRTPEKRNYNFSM
jgi:hypothetical protein